MSSNYLFNEVTGQSDYERQSWRDSYNGGRAAGDITGNVNRELDAQREANNGRTESGSSTQYAAFEIAPAGAPKSSGPGNHIVTQGPVAAGRQAGGVGPGSPGAATLGNRGAFRSQLTVQLPYDAPSKLMPLVVGGRNMAHDAGWSNAADVEDRLGEGEFLSPSWFYSWGVSGADAWANASVNNGGPIRTGKVQEDLYNAPGVFGGWVKTIGEGFLDTRAAMRDPFGPDHPTPGFRTGGF